MNYNVQCGAISETCDKVIIHCTVFYGFAAMNEFSYRCLLKTWINAM